MGTRMMRVDWHEPVSLHVHPDATDARASQLRQASGGVVQLLLGAEVSADVWVQDAAGPVAARIGEIIDGVTSIELDSGARDDDTAVADDTVLGTDDTVVSTDGIAAQSPESALPLTRTGNDVDDTIIGQPAFPGALSELDDATILGQPPVIASGVDDPDASADTIIGPGRARAVPSTATAPPTLPPAVPPILPPTGAVLPPPLPAMPIASVSASAHVNAGVAPTGARRTRIEAPDPVDPGRGTISVSFPDGRLVALDRTVYVGRSPKSPRITSGVVPELVAVVSPRREVSSTHLEIQQEGRAVVVRDLGSTNGTRVSVPGAAPSMLSPGASRVVSPGTLLDLGDDVVLELVAPTAGAGGGSW